MKSSFVWAFVLVQHISFITGSPLRAQDGRPQASAKKNNFTFFSRTHINRGKLWMARNKAFLNHRDANFGDEYSPGNKAVELFEKRTINSKFYINKDTPSVFYSQHSSGPMHFKRNGQWITIDTRLSPKGPLLYEASTQEDPVGFDIKKKSSYITTSGGKTYFNQWKLYGENGNTRTLLATADWSNYTVGDDGLAIKNIFPGVDAEMKVSKGSIKTNFIVHANKFPAYKTLLFKDAFLNAYSGSFSFSNGVTGNGLVSSADFRVKASNVFRIKEAVMYQKVDPSSTFQFVPYYLDHNNLTLAVSSDLLNAGVRNGDVVIDPLVQSTGVVKDTILASHSNQSCSFDTACRYDFVVPAPALATIIDAMFSFEFTANAPCVGQDGAFSFIINNTCTSQKYVGTATGAGPQNFPNQSIILNNGSSVASCFPAPVCGPQNIPFSFNFFRNCHGPTGCDGTCIGASKDLTIVLVGRTLDSASLVASTQNSCAGAPVTLRAAGYFGVGPYNFAWQGLPQVNSDSIRVNPDTTTVYTVQVSDACPGGAAPITKSVTVNVLAKLPAPTFTSNSPVCVGGQLILTVPAIAGTTYTIKNTGSGLGGGPYTSTAVFDTVTTAYAGTWIAVATNVNGCTSDTARTTVVVNPTITPTVSISSSSTNVCSGTTVSFTATATNAGASPTYQWFVNGQKVGTNSPSYSSTGFVNNDSVKCVVTVNQSCGTTSGTSNVIVLHITPVVTPTFDTIGPFCQNSIPPKLPLTSNEGITGTWSPATINTSAIGTITYKFTPSAADSCSKPASIDITIATTISPSFPTISDSYCQNDTLPPLPTTSREGITGTWSPSSVNTADLGRTVYTFTPTPGSCGVALQVSITVNALPILMMGPDVNIAPGETTTLNVSTTGNIVAYHWTPSTGLNDTTIKNPVASPSVTTVYTLEITDDKNCHATGTMTVTVSGGTSKISVPNAFSPNGDGVNDTWVISSLSSYPGATVDVYNRYGQLVFHSENNSKNWDGTLNGKPVPMATYYYIVDPKNNEKKIAGSVTIFK